MDDAHDGPYAREPQIEDLLRICRALNDAGARYVLIGDTRERRPPRLRTFPYDFGLNRLFSAPKS